MDVTFDPEPNNFETHLTVESELNTKTDLILKLLHIPDINNGLL